MLTLSEAGIDYSVERWLPREQVVALFQRFARDDDAWLLDFDWAEICDHRYTGRYRTR